MLRRPRGTVAGVRGRGAFSLPLCSCCADFSGVFLSDSGSGFVGDGDADSYSSSPVPATVWRLLPSFLALKFDGPAICPMTPLTSSLCGRGGVGLLFGLQFSRMPLVVEFVVGDKDGRKLRFIRSLGNVLCNQGLNGYCFDWDPAFLCVSVVACDRGRDDCTKTASLGPSNEVPTTELC